MGKKADQNALIRNFCKKNIEKFRRSDAITTPQKDLNQKYTRFDVPKNAHVFRKKHRAET